MPLYDFEDKETGDQFTLMLSISKKEKFLELNPQVKSVILSAPSLVSGVNFESKQDAGWKENLSRIAEAHPNSALADKVGGRSATQAKVNSIAAKHGSRSKGRYNMDF